MKRKRNRFKFIEVEKEKRKEQGVCFLLVWVEFFIMILIVFILFAMIYNGLK